MKKKCTSCKKKSLIHASSKEQWYALCEECFDAMLTPPQILPVIMDYIAKWYKILNSK